VKNLVGYTPLSNPDWITLKFEDGTESDPVNDPTGEYRAEVESIAQKIAGVPPNPMAGATASLGSELAGGAGGLAKADVPTTALGVPSPAGAAPMPPGAIAEPPKPAGDRGKVETVLKYAMKPQPEGGMPAGGDGGAPGAPPSTTVPQPQPPIGAPQPSPLQVTGTTSSWQRQESNQRSSSGIAEADRGKVEAASEDAVRAAEKANSENYVAQATQYWHEFGRLSEQAKKQVAERAVLQEQERAFNGRIEAAYKKYDEDAARPIDPSRAFAGEKRAYAFMAGFGDVLRNVGAALAGKGPVVDPGEVIDSLIEREVNLQMAQKEQDLKAGRMSIDRFTAERETIRHRLGVVLTQMTQNELDRAQNQQAYQALGALKAKGDAIVADARKNGAIALARQETISQGTQTNTGGTTQRETRTAGGAASLDQISKLLDIEKKKLELESAQLDRLDAQEASRITGNNMSPQRLEKLRATLKENAAPMAKLDSFLGAIQSQLEVNGATIDRNTGEIKWGEDVEGVGYGKLHEMGPVGESLAEGLNTKGLQLKKAQEFLSQLVTNDVTGAVSTLQQDAVFKDAVGGASNNPEAYKQALERLAKFAIERRNGFLAPLGQDGIRLYRHNEALARKGLVPSAKEIGTLPEGRR